LLRQGWAERYKECCIGKLLRARERVWTFQKTGGNKSKETGEEVEGATADCLSGFRAMESK
jgi:hypothetical protein